MSELKDKRVRFTRCLIELVDWANLQPDWEVALGRDYDEANPDEPLRHMPGSLHYLGLANDLCLYISGVYQNPTEAYRAMGDYWKMMGADLNWGGDFKKRDGNHFSIAYGGRK
jgi:hypothetical protein